MCNEPKNQPKIWPSVFLFIVFAALILLGAIYIFCEHATGISLLLVICASLLGTVMGMINLLLDHQKLEIKGLSLAPLTLQSILYLGYRIITGMALAVAVATVLKQNDVTESAIYLSAFFASYVFDVSKLLYPK
ncbi:hypothetical protein HC956_08200 [Alcaligenes faecalis]|uniref:Uncharacterized protein n=1 Tax=Alcaligenes ammonioxydans TaxID=2582914 RepID=A0ABX8SYM7_9BURK|nr:hypothetical protein [Alcaligenes ammonioxydans]QXX78999.1 hypothetical protein FE795_08200 [Alcaligenes ammonioxydans]